MASRAPGPRSTSGFPAEDGPLFVGLTAVRGSSLDASTDPTAKRHLYFYSSRSENTSGESRPNEQNSSRLPSPWVSRRTSRPAPWLGVWSTAKPFPAPGGHRAVSCHQPRPEQRGSSAASAPHPRPPLEASRVLGDSLVSAEAAHSQRDDFFVTLVLCRHLLLQMQSLEKEGREEEGSWCCCIARNTPLAVWSGGWGQDGGRGRARVNLVAGQQTARPMAPRAEPLVGGEDTLLRRGVRRGTSPSPSVSHGAAPAGSAGDLRG